MDRGAWVGAGQGGGVGWGVAAVHGVAKSWTQLKQLSTRNTTPNWKIKACKILWTSLSVSTNVQSWNGESGYHLCHNMDSSVLTFYFIMQKFIVLDMLKWWTLFIYHHQAASSCIILFILSFHRYLLGPYHIPDNVQGTENTICPLPKCVCYSLSRVWLFVILWTAAHQAPLSMEFSRQEYWSGLSIPSLGHLPDPGIEPGCPAL